VYWACEPDGAADLAVLTWLVLTWLALAGIAAAAATAAAAVRLLSTPSFLIINGCPSGDREMQKALSLMTLHRIIKLTVRKLFLKRKKEPAAVQ
jgi:hypothetical protein